MLPTKLPKAEDILFLRGDINYTEFHLVNGRKMVSSTTLLRYEEKFEEFVRVSRKHLVNPEFVRSVENFGVQVSLKMSNGNTLKISRRRLEFVRLVFKIIKQNI